MRGVAPTGREIAGEETGEKKKKNNNNNRGKRNGKGREKKWTERTKRREAGKQGSRGIEAAEGGHVGLTLVFYLLFFVVFWRRVSGGRGYGRVQGIGFFFFKRY